MLFKRLKDKIKAIFSEEQETTENPQVVIRNHNPGDVKPVIPRPDPHLNTNDMRTDIIESELFEETHSTTRKHVQIIQAGISTPTSEEKRVFTPEDGLLTANQDFLLDTCDGRLIQNTDLKGGGRCVVCQGYTDKIFFCEICRLPLCFKCAHPWETFKVCPPHYKILRFNQDTW